MSSWKGCGFRSLEVDVDFDVRHRDIYTQITYVVSVGAVREPPLPQWLN
jgi:hypothetical protein